MEASRADVHRQLDELRSEMAELRASRMRLVLTDVAERRDLERALHDGLQQQLAGLAAGVELAARSLDEDPGAARQLLGETSHELRRALDDARALAHRIYPPLLEAGGLVAALRSVAAMIGVPIRIHVAAEMDHMPHLAGLVYFCCRDVLERADADIPVRVTVVNRDDTLTFEIVAAADLEAEDLPIRDRVEALGGRLTRSFADQGIRLVGSLPLSG